MLRYISHLLVVFLASTSFAFAANSVVQLDAKGTTALVPVPSSSGDKATAYFLTKGNETQYVSFRVMAPTGTKITAKSTFLGTAKPTDVLAKSSGWVNSSFVAYDGAESQVLKVGTAAKTVRSATLSKTPEKLARGSGVYCGNYTAADLDRIIAAITQISPLTYSRNELCQIYGYTPGSAYQPDTSTNPGFTNNQNGSNPDNVNPDQSYTSGSMTSVLAQVLVRKDTCGVKANGVYLVKLDIVFDGVPQENLTPDSQITLSALPIDYRGSKASSLKPTSDGKFAPKALFLMATTGGFNYSRGPGSERMNVVRWSKGSPAIRNLKVEDMVYWRGFQLARTVAEPALKGGKGVVELHSSVGVYSVCFSLSKRRQRLNGYGGK